MNRYFQTCFINDENDYEDELSELAYLKTLLEKEYKPETFS